MRTSSPGTRATAVLDSRRLTLRPAIWGRAVDAWLADDPEALDAIWDDTIPDLGSEYDSYAYVSSIGWSA